MVPLERITCLEGAQSAHVAAVGHGVQQRDAGRVVESQDRDRSGTDAGELLVVDQHRDVVGGARCRDLLRVGPRVEWARSAPVRETATIVSA